MNYFTLIESCYPSLSKSEQKVADYIKKNTDKVVYQSIQEVANEIKIGETTVLRFCRKLGFKGFKDMKLHIAKENVTLIPEHSDNYMEEIVNNFKYTIENTYLVTNQKLIKAAALSIKKASRVFLFGVGASAYASLDMESRLLRYGKLVYNVADPHFQMMKSSILSSKDLVIVFSISGTTIDIFDSVNLAKKNKAKIIAITNHILSPLGKSADICIVTAGKESPIDGGSLTGRLSQLLIVDFLCTAYALLDEDLSKSMKEKTANSILNKTI